ncbi:uncharacterized protein L969DRAFT_95587 [Mixia osmundae IAM 14324]|uniref:BZIP domain-containing protein n=1 Tax=Mixia osmundae (strain CBS 9802 / IAM 14324 / JCM 22182 / KY 12970) TaxID=764103 RepID=G7E7V0_MIXOS|nr:uncharacterized protein L969DRAFT_95587 [Mixia osmundae IAM 14324]KEI38511.1 hypothetical protein L969DRAFT_95587 [Mixia osmundae IAM 14324]GAA98910.1 hypothetical protein E5Q_05598 [Mixia osmundae IAM 14324]
MFDLAGTVVALDAEGTNRPSKRRHIADHAGPSSLAVGSDGLQQVASLARGHHHHQLAQDPMESANMFLTNQHEHGMDVPVQGDPMRSESQDYMHDEVFGGAQSSSTRHRESPLVDPLADIDTSMLTSSLARRVAAFPPHPSVPLAQRGRKRGSTNAKRDSEEYDLALQHAAELDHLDENGKPLSKTIRDQRRAEQNRAAQKAFRDRREDYVRQLIRRSDLLTEVQRSIYELDERERIVDEKERQAQAESETPVANGLASEETVASLVSQVSTARKTNEILLARVMEAENALSAVKKENEALRQLHEADSAALRDEIMLLRTGLTE